MSPSIREQYNTLHYESYPIRAAYLPSIEATARLFGLHPAPSRRCRVLELACGEGINLVSLALRFPGSEFIGVDIADEAIRRGQQNLAALDVPNVRLQAADIMTLDESLGQFDYILAHGFFSWVPAPVRQQILYLTRHLLAPQGVAFISYNSLPGGRVRELVRDTLRYHTRAVTDPAERTKAAREFAQFLLEGFAKDDRRAGARYAFQALLERSDWSFYHDELGEINEQFMFRDFMTQARQHGLDFLSEADFANGFTQAIPSIDDIIEREQYIDFATVRQFRQTLLRREETTIDRNRLQDHLAGLYAHGDVRSPAGLDSSSDAPAEFKLEGSGSVKTNHPVMKTVLYRICAAYPEAVSVDEIVAAVESLPDRYELGAREFLLQLAQSGVIQLYSEPFGLALFPSDKPRAYKLARYRVGHQPLVPNLFHKTVKLEGEATARFVRAMDGTRNWSDLGTLAGVGPEELQIRLLQMSQLGLLEA